MQSKHEGILRSINNDGSSLNILSTPTHERYQSNWASLKHVFYLFQHPSFNKWHGKYAKLPKNHIMLDGGPNQIKPDMKLDLVLSQNKFGNFQVLSQIAEQLNLPLISLEHTLPVESWNQKIINQIQKMRGNINVFISEYSVNKWGFSIDDSSVRIIHHGVDIETFKPNCEISKNGKVSSLVNDWINRDYFCGWSIYQRITKDLPIDPLGDTPGFSKASNGVQDVVKHLQKAQVFVNTSTISPIPTALLEAMACGCVCVSTATCMIPEIIKDGHNGFISNDEKVLRERLEWCLNNPDKTIEIGQNARKTIEDKFSLQVHLDKWNKIFLESYGKGRNW